MATNFPIWYDSDFNTVTDTSQMLTTTMAAGVSYVLSVSVGAYFKVGAATPTASAADGSHYMPAGSFRVISPDGTDNRVAVIRVGGADGVCTLSKVGLP